MSFLWSFVWSFVVAYGIARILVWANGTTIIDGFLVGLLAGVCFVVASMTINNLFDRRPVAPLTINVSYHAVALMAAGIIIGAWR